MNLNDLEKPGEGIPARRYADYLVMTPKELSLYLGKRSENLVREYLNGTKMVPESVLMMLRSLAYAKSTMSERDYTRLKGFLTGRITVPMRLPEELNIYERQG